MKPNWLAKALGGEIMRRGNRAVLFASVVLPVWVVWVPGNSVVQAGPIPDSNSFFGVGQPAGPVTPSLLRTQQPLYLLNLCRQVKAGRLDRRSVAPLVGGDMTLSAILAMDLDRLYERLTAAQEPSAAPLPTLWQRVLTNDGTTPLPPLDPPAEVTFLDVLPGDSPSQFVRVTSPIDGSLQASLPRDAPFRIVSMRTYDGLVVRLPDAGRTSTPDVSSAPGFTYTILGPQFSRGQAPWVVPVQAGQDVDIEVGIPPGTAMPPVGLHGAITIGNGTNDFWTVPLQAWPIGSSIFVYIYGANLKPIQLTWPAVIQAGSNKQSFVVPMILASPFPPSLVQGKVQLASGPQGLSMPPVNFTLQPNGQINLPLTLDIDNGTPAYSNTNVPQNFSLQISYHDVPIQNAGSQTVTLHYTIYPESRYWQASGSDLGINCFQNLTLFATGDFATYGQCTNFNIYSARVAVQFSLGATPMGAVGWDFSPNSVQKASWQGFAGSPPYPTLQAQPFIVEWDFCAPQGFCVK